MAIRTVLAAAAALLGAYGSAVQASDLGAFVPAAYWRADFGAGQGFQPALGLALQRGARETTLPALLRLDVSPSQLLARVAGVPVGARQFRLDQSETAAAVPVETHWYTHQWVWWTAGGLAATAALAAAGGSGETHITNGSGGDGNNGSNVNIACNNGLIGDGNNSCVAQCQGQITSPDCGTILTLSHRGATVARRIDDAWTMAGTGQMGDLPAR